MPPRYAPQLVRSVSSSWMPTRSDVAELEERLPDFVAHQSGFHRSVAGDYKQYVGIVRGVRRLIFVNAFSIPDGAPVTTDWKSRPIVWGGGGDTVWRVEFDPQQKTFEAFEVNGPL